MYIHHGLRPGNEETKITSNKEEFHDYVYVIHEVDGVADVVYRARRPSLPVCSQICQGCYNWPGRRPLTLYMTRHRS